MQAMLQNRNTNIPGRKIEKILIRVKERKKERKKYRKYKLMRVLRSLINVDDKNTFILCFYMRRF